MELLKDHSDMFAKSSTDLSLYELLQHNIDTGDSPPTRQSPRRPPVAAQDAEDAVVDDMLESGVIEPSNSSLASPVCLVRKKDGTFRFVSTIGASMQCQRKTHTQCRTYRMPSTI